MSYILDALKKSEQDRGNGSIPNVQTIHSSALSYHQEKRPLWPWLLIAVLVVNIAILIYFLKPDSNDQSIISSINTVEKNNDAESHQQKKFIEQNSIPVQEAVITAPVEPTTEQTIPDTDKRIPTIEATVVTPVSQASAPAQVIDIDELPAAIRQQIPDMIFSAHVYSSAPMQRSLVINDRFMEEGYAVGYDLVLVEITRNGAIFDFRGHLFSTSVLSGWGNP